MAASCSSFTPTARAISRSSQRVDRALNHSYEALYEAPVKLETRYNPCSCDPALEFECRINGYWRHVQIVGSEEALKKLHQTARSLEPHQIFELSLIISDDLYTATNGQQFYILTLAGES